MPQRNNGKKQEATGAFPVNPEEVIRILNDKLAQANLECAAMTAGFRQSQEECAALRKQLDEMAAAITAKNETETVKKKEKADA